MDTDVSQLESLYSSLVLKGSYSNLCHSLALRSTGSFFWILNMFFAFDCLIRSPMTLTGGNIALRLEELRIPFIYHLSSPGANQLMGGNLVPCFPIPSLERVQMQ